MCDQWYSSRVVTLLPFDTVNYATPLKAKETNGQLPLDKYDARFVDRILHSRVLSDPSMLCDAISVVAEFMVRVMHPRGAIGSRDCWLEANIPG
jgi:hypothetical protein